MCSNGHSTRDYGSSRMHQAFLWRKSWQAQTDRQSIKMGGTAGWLAYGKVHPSREEAAHKGQQSYRQTKDQCPKADNADIACKKRHSIPISADGVRVHVIRCATSKLSVPTSIQPGLERGNLSPLRREVGSEIYEQQHCAKAWGPAHVDYEQAGERQRGAIVRKFGNVEQYEFY